MADGFVDIQFVGLESVIADFNRLKYGVQGKIVRNAMAEAVQPIAAKARELVPVDTGRLKNSIATRVIKSRGKILGQVYCGFDPFDESGMFKGDTYYAGMVEYGHRIGKRQKGISRMGKKLAALRKTQRSVHSTEIQARDAAREEAKILRIHETRQGFVPAQPFLRPALASMRMTALAILSNSVRSQIAAYMSRKGTGHLRGTVSATVKKGGGRSSKRFKKGVSLAFSVRGTSRKFSRRRGKPRFVSGGAGKILSAKAYRKMVGDQGYRPL